MLLLIFYFFQVMGHSKQPYDMLDLGEDDLLSIRQKGPSALFKLFDPAAEDIELLHTKQNQVH